MLKPIRLMTAVGTGPTLDDAVQEMENAAEKILDGGAIPQGGISVVCIPPPWWLAWFINSKFYVAQSFFFPR